MTDVEELDELYLFLANDFEQIGIVTEPTCAYCAVVLEQRKSESSQRFYKRRYCNSRCYDDRKKQNRPAGWEKLHKEARAFRKDNCQACGHSESLHAHHIDGDINHNTEINIQTLCAWCHNFIHAVQKRMSLEIPGKMPEIVVSMEVVNERK